MEAVVRLVRGPFAASVASKMGTLPAEAVESVRQTVASSADGLEAQVPTVTEVVTEGLADKCVEVRCLDASTEMVVGVLGICGSGNRTSAGDVRFGTLCLGQLVLLRVVANSA